MAASATPKSKTTPRKAATARARKVEPVVVDNGLVDQMRAMAGKVLDAGAATVGAAASLKAAAGVARALSQGKTMEAAADVLKAVMPSLAEPGVWARTGAALKRLRQASVAPIGAVMTKVDMRDGRYGYESAYYYYRSTNDAPRLAN